MSASRTKERFNEQHIIPTADTVIPKLKYPKDKYDLISVDYIDKWDSFRFRDKHHTGKLTPTYDHHHSVTVTLRCKKCGTVRQCQDKYNLACDSGPCHPGWEDLTGKKYGRLTLLSYEFGNFGAWHTKEKWYWKCRCDCGNICYKTANSLHFHGQIECVQCARRHAKEKRTLPDQKALWNRKYGMARKGAIARNYVFELSPEQYKELCLQPCYYCGAPPSPVFGGLVANGVDRFDNTKGYIADNCVPCCPRCNEMKMTASYTDWIAQMERILKHCKERSTTIPQGSTPKQVETDSPEKEDIV